MFENDSNSHPTKLPASLTRNGFVYSLVKRQDDVAIYQQHVTPEISRFEVFKVKVQKPTTFVMGGQEVTLEHKELFPGNNEFGSTAFSCWDLPRAEVKFEDLLNLSSCSSVDAFSLAYGV